MTNDETTVAGMAIVAATETDMPAIEEMIHRFRLDDEALHFSQFIVVRKEGRLVAFGRIKPYRHTHELGCVGVVEDDRGKGLGEIVVRELIKRYPTNEVYITTDLPKYFARFGFETTDKVPEELAAKIDRVCGRLRTGVIAMVLHRQP